MNTSKFAEMIKAHAGLLVERSDCKKANHSFLSSERWRCAQIPLKLEDSAATIGQEVHDSRMNDPDHKVFSQRRFDPMFFSHLAFTACAQSSRPMSTGASGSGTGTIDFGGRLDCKAHKTEMTKWVNAFVEKESLGRQSL